MSTQPVKKHFTMTIKDFYRDFRKEEMESGKTPHTVIPYKVFRSVIEDFFYEISRKIIYDNFTFMMPYSLGSIVVKAFKNNLKNLNIDWKATKEHGKVVRHLNLHTFGYCFGIVWDKSYVRFRNNTYYNFSATQSKPATKLGIGKKGLSNHIIELSKDPNRRSYIKI